MRLESNEISNESYLILLIWRQELVTYGAQALSTLILIGNGLHVIDFSVFSRNSITKMKAIVRLNANCEILPDPDDSDGELVKHGNLFAHVFSA